MRMFVDSLRCGMNLIDNFTRKERAREYKSEDSFKMSKNKLFMVVEGHI